jgi:hypothetical protein
MNRARRVALLAVILCALCAAPAFGAGQGYVDEPEFTKPTAINASPHNGALGNTWWFTWSYPPGAEYRYCFAWGNGVRVGTQTNGPTPANSMGCSGSYINGSGGLAPDVTAYLAAQLSGANFPSGQARHVCIQSQVFIASSWSKYLDWTCETVTGDSSVPTASISLDSGAAYTRDTTVAAVVGYTDSLSVPFTNSTNWGVFPCSAAASNCTPNVGADPGKNWCAAPPAVLSTNWSSCNRSVPGGGDGVRSICVRVADSAIDDQQNGSTVVASGNGLPPQRANLSARACDTITLDATEPSLSLNANDMTPETGQSVQFGASASDATSGVPGSVSWNFGDGGTANGSSVSHTYSSTGTKTVTASVTDGAGNMRTQNLVLTVSGPSTPPPTTTTSTSTTTTAPTTSTPPPPGGGGGSDNERFGYDAPDKLSLSDSKRKLTVSVVAPGPGQVELAVAPKSKPAKGASTTKQVPAGDSKLKLKLPRSFGPGKYSLTVAYESDTGTSFTDTRALKLKR